MPGATLAGENTTQRWNTNRAAGGGEVGALEESTSAPLVVRMLKLCKNAFLDNVPQNHPSERIWGLLYLVTLVKVCVFWKKSSAEDQLYSHIWFMKVNG
jgi:hypothetical protein